MEQQNSDTLAGSLKKRPVFLTILCILSFIGICYVIFSSLNNLFIFSSSESIYEKHNAAGNSFFESIDVNGINNYNSIYKSYNITCIIAALICLAGVLFMWKLKKTGYYIYVAGELTPIITFFILFWNFFHNPLLSFTFLITPILMFIVAVAFLIMYAVNLKSMS